MGNGVCSDPCVCPAVSGDTRLVQDLLAVVTSFSARLYGARGGRKILQGFRELIMDAEETQKGQI
ncbi:hypothetical protein [Fervidicola ferrireducens]|uniref:hypothetical protein n=1 Tax=Fervidicola ferrireducens TaxID=520764 RepID=UPI0012EEC589|nr:hypothetical protein [Fervidicola ferrireducens]